MDSLYEFVANYLATKPFLFVLMSAAAFALVPKTYQTYLKWQKTQKATDFSNAIFLGTLSLLFLTSVYPLFVFAVLDLNSMFSVGVYRTLIFIAFIYFAVYFSLPKMLSYYQRLKIKKTSSNFTFMCLFALISFYCLSVFFILTLDLTISAAR